MSEVQLKHRVSKGYVTIETEFYYYMYYWSFLFLSLCIAIRLWPCFTCKLLNN